MRLCKLALAIVALAVFAIACNDTSTNQTANVSTNVSNAATPTPARPTPTPDEFATTRATFAATCQRCHKPDGSGGEAEDDKGKKFRVPSLREGSAAKHTDEQLARKITNGDIDEGMPAFKDRLSPEQINELVRFIRKEFQGQSAASPANSNAAANANTNTPANTR